MNTEKKPIIMMAQPDDTCFVWEVDLFLDRLIRLDMTNEAHVLWYIPTDRQSMGVNPYVELLENKYKTTPSIKFFYYNADKAVEKDINSIQYISLLRPYCLKNHFLKHPELKEEVIFYCDSDIAFVKAFPFEKFVEGDTCYVSDTASYLNLQYLEGKIEQSEKADKLRALDPINEIAKQVGISKQIIALNNEGTGGAQYILKNIDFDFWDSVYYDSIAIRRYFKNLNKHFFPSENAGWQSWCADMWAVLWNLWKRGVKTEVPKEMDFAWGTSPADYLNRVYIYHNAGVTSKIMNMNGEDVVMFYKGIYRGAEMIKHVATKGAVLFKPDGTSAPVEEGAYMMQRNVLSPLRDRSYLQVVSPLYCSKFYADCILAMKNPVLK